MRLRNGTRSRQSDEDNAAFGERDHDPISHGGVGAHGDWPRRREQRRALEQSDFPRARIKDANPLTE